MFENFYRCEDCEIEWQDVWDSACDDECPNCETPYTPYMSREYHKPQYIIFCLPDTDPYEEPKNDYTYVQVSRRRFNKTDAIRYKEGIAEGRNAVMVEVPYVPVDENGYPSEKRQSF